jgi:diaminopimelate decarboxylase
VLHHIDLGGGLGIRYSDEDAPTVRSYLQPLLAELKGRGAEDPARTRTSPGRQCRRAAHPVEYLKPGEVKNFAIVDAAMNDLARPALYDAWHDIVPVAPRTTAASDGKSSARSANPAISSATAALALQEGDLLAIMSAGAYGMAMSSNYNTRPRAPEVMVDGTEAHLVRRRDAAMTPRTRWKTLPPSVMHCAASLKQPAAALAFPATT